MIIVRDVTYLDGSAPSLLSHVRRRWSCSGWVERKALEARRHLYLWMRRRVSYRLYKKVEHLYPLCQTLSQIYNGKNIRLKNERQQIYSYTEMLINKWEFFKLWFEYFEHFEFYNLSSEERLLNKLYNFWKHLSQLDYHDNVMSRVCVLPYPSLT